MDEGQRKMDEGGGLSVEFLHLGGPGDFDLERGEAVAASDAERTLETFGSRYL